ncbi:MULTISPECIES: hypothetical protein [Bacteria]
MTDVTGAHSARAAEYAELLGSMDAVHPADRLVICGQDETPAMWLSQ